MSSAKRIALSVREAGQLIGMGKSAAYKAARAGDLPTVRINGRSYVPIAKLAAMFGLDADTLLADDVF